MRAKIKQKKEVARLTLEVIYDLMGDEADFKPGQFFFVTLTNAPYKDNGKDPVHHFTIINSPLQKGILSNTTRLRDTAFKNSLREMPAGSEVVVDRIMGNFILPDDASKSYCFIALGIGITPYISMLRYIQEIHLNYKITLIYSDSDRESMAYLEELEKYAQQNSNFKIILTVTRDNSWKGEKRHVDEQFIKDYIENPKDTTYFVSGPPRVVEIVGKAIEKSGVPKENIRTEDFSGY